MIKKCYCGREFITYPSKIKLGKGKYCSKECAFKITNKILEANGKKFWFVKGQKAWNRKEFVITKARVGGKRYRLIYKPEHPLATMRGYIREHRLIMETHLGRYLDRCEVVHHIDENTLNNKLSNLELLSGTEHRRKHLKDNVHKRWIGYSAPSQNETEYNPNN